MILIGMLFVALRGGSAKWHLTGHESPNEVLQLRLAAGEITPQQHEERKALLDRNAHQRDGA